MPVFIMMNSDCALASFVRDQSRQKEADRSCLKQRHHERSKHLEVSSSNHFVVSCDNKESKNTSEARVNQISKKPSTDLMETIQKFALAHPTVDV